MVLHVGLIGKSITIIDTTGPANHDLRKKNYSKQATELHVNDLQSMFLLLTT
jgi:hypothetical protein